MISEIKETRVIKTDVAANGSVTRTETITIIAPNEKLMDAHLATSRPWDCKTGPSLMESIFGKVGR